MLLMVLGGVAVVGIGLGIYFYVQSPAGEPVPTPTPELTPTPVMLPFESQFGRPSDIVISDPGSNLIEFLKSKLL